MNQAYSYCAIKLTIKRELLTEWTCETQLRAHVSKAGRGSEARNCGHVSAEFMHMDIYMVLAHNYLVNATDVVKGVHVKHRNG